jgi:hypothetical protein
METEKLLTFVLCLEIWQFEVNYGDFICVTCIVYADLVENFKCAVWI